MFKFIDLYISFFPITTTIVQLNIQKNHLLSVLVSLVPRLSFLVLVSFQIHSILFPMLALGLVKLQASSLLIELPFYSSLLLSLPLLLKGEYIFWVRLTKLFLRRARTLSLGWFLSSFSTSLIPYGSNHRTAPN